MSDESLRLAAIADVSRYASGVSSDSTRHAYRIFERFLTGDSILEMGPAEGVMTELLARTGRALCVVEGSALFCESIARRFPGVEVAHALFEDYQPTRQFDNIVLGHVLEHVRDPHALVSRAAGWLTPRGRLLAAVPNARSLHRQAAVLMGLLPGEDSLNATDLAHGHRRVFDPESFRQCFIGGGLSIEAFGGYWLKPLSNAQIEQAWTPSMVEAFMELGERYPDIAAVIYVIARAPLR